ncbi:hypothetical protein MNBD_GAMMA15-1657 [hydrothermal vent metagenome]|uniref:Uncharacterized protein n=1 Tax=hydrothermal vent metagenome TaxID=652676 RepID=A0A3B0ZG12_9ZZZZ
MNIIERLGSRAIGRIHEMQDEYALVRHELREMVAENKRLRYMLYAASGEERKALLDQPESIHSLPEQPPWQRHMDSGRVDRALATADAAAQGVRERTKIDTYFDVTIWRWVAEAVIPYRTML